MSKRALSHYNMDIPGVWKTAFRNAEEPFPLDIDIQTYAVRCVFYKYRDLCLTYYFPESEKQNVKLRMCVN